MASPSHLVALFDAVLDSTLPSLRTSFEAEFLALFAVTTCVKSGAPSSAPNLFEPSSALRGFLLRVLALQNIDMGIRYSATSPQALQSSNFDKFPVGAFAVALVHLSIHLPEWWTDAAIPSAGGKKTLRRELLSRLKQWEPIIGGAFALCLLKSQNPAEVIDFFWRDLELYDTENTVHFD